MAENIFCKAFGAKNLARSDISFDACKGNFGIGLKTFLYKNGRPIEKIAEFNKDRKIISSSDPLDMVKTVANLRNKRLVSTRGICGVGVENMLYHCVAKTEGKFLIHETKMNLIHIEGITTAKEVQNTITFTDGVEEYTYNISKSTLFKKFLVDPVFEIDVKIFDDPYQVLVKDLTAEFDMETAIKNPIVATIYLPLYSERGGIHVPQKSQLNQWNAGGRSRNDNEVYIPIPISIKRAFPNFFPPRDRSFVLQLPSGSSLSAKICQDNDKALMRILIQH